MDQKKEERCIPKRNSTGCFCIPEFRSKQAGKKGLKNKMNEVFQQEILRVASVFPNFNLKKLGKRSYKKIKVRSTDTKNFTCRLCSRDYLYRGGGEEELHKTKEADNLLTRKLAA